MFSFIASRRYVKDAQQKLKEAQVEVLNIPKFEFPPQVIETSNNRPANPKVAALIYLVEHRALSALKVGVTSSFALTDRIRQHVLNNWEVCKVWEVDSMNSAIKVEQAVINWWRRELNSWPALRADEMPQGGYTETVSSVEVSRARTMEFIENVIDEKSVLDLQVTNIQHLEPGKFASVQGYVKSCKIDFEEVFAEGRQNKSENYLKVGRPIFRALVQDSTGLLLVERHLNKTFRTQAEIDAGRRRVAGKGMLVRVSGRTFTVSNQRNLMGIINPTLFQIDSVENVVVIGGPENEMRDSTRCACGKETFNSLCVTCSSDKPYEFSIPCGICGNLLTQDRYRGGHIFRGSPDDFRCTSCYLYFDKLHIFGELARPSYESLVIQQPRTTVEWERRTGRTAQTETVWRYDTSDPDTEPDYQ